MKNDIWEKIETAPKDGSPILAWQAETIYKFGFGICGYFNNEWELLNPNGTGLSIGFYPTHWVPLPHCPEDKQGSLDGWFDLVLED